MRANLPALIARSRSWQYARDLKRRPLGPDDRLRLTNLATEFLSRFPYVPGACVIMSAGFADLARERLYIPAVVVAGALSIGRRAFYAPSPSSSVSTALDTSTLEWDGHAWMIAGDHIVDLSIFRTAYSGVGPPGLREEVLRRFGDGLGAFIARLEAAAAEGMHYTPFHVLRPDQEMAFAIAARTIQDMRRAGASQSADG